MRKYILFLILIIPMSSFANDYQQEINEFFKLYESGKKTEAVDSIYRTNPWMRAAADSIEHVKTQLRGIEKLVGNYNGKEKIGEFKIKQRYVHITYLALYDRQPIRMEFQFYRPKTDWIIYSFSFDDKFPDDMEKKARGEIMMK